MPRMKLARDCVFTRRSSLAVGPDEACELLVDRALDPAEISAGLCRGANHELAADLAEIDVGTDVGRDLLVIDESLVEPRRLPRGEDVGDEIEVVRVGRAVLGD